MKVILRYVEEGWLGRTQNRVEGIIFHYDPENDTKTKIKDVPEKDILAKIEGNWQDKLYFTLSKSPVRATQSNIHIGSAFTNSQLRTNTS